MGIPVLIGRATNDHLLVFNGSERIEFESQGDNIMTTARIIPLAVARPDPLGATTAKLAAIDELTARLESTGYMAVMQIGEPHLSELVAKFKRKGYHVELAPLVVEDGSAGSGGCGSASSCSSASSGCSSGGCGTAAPAPAPASSRMPRMVMPDISVIYVRLGN